MDADFLQGLGGRKEPVGLAPIERVRKAKFNETKFSVPILGR
jgi:hypothetical protein